MTQRILDGTLSKAQYEYKKNYPGQGGDIYFNTYQVYDRTVDQPGVLDQGTLKTFQLVKKGNDWYKGAELGVDGKWRTLTEKESGILVPNSDTSKPGTFKPIPGATDEKVLGDVVIRDLNAGGTTSLRYQAINNAKFQLKKAGGLTDQQVNKEFDISKNIKPPGGSGTPGLLGDPVAADEATPNPTQGTADITDDDITKIEKEQKTVQSRNKYEDVIYPIGLDSKFQDCIKFSIIKYTPSGLKGFAESEEEKNLRRVFYDDANGYPNVKGKGRERLGTIVLPIPGGIQDTNQVSWSESSLDPFMQSLGKLAQTGLEGKDMAKVAGQELGSIAGDPNMRKTIISKFTSDAIKGSNIMQRQFGTMINPNMELLFNSPYLRTFSFSFKLSPRSAKEAENVKKIIRTFKQAMSVKRSASSFLLQTPHTFAISYVFKEKEHPYLNKFKECALTSCTVNYTPEGNYMAFDDSNNPSMVSYQLDLQFQELEPVYDDDYGKQDYDNIGY